jgi:hypothetical protein
MLSVTGSAPQPKSPTLTRRNYERAFAAHHPQKASRCTRSGTPCSSGRTGELLDALVRDAEQLREGTAGSGEEEVVAVRGRGRAPPPSIRHGYGRRSTQSTFQWYFRPPSSSFSRVMIFPGVPASSHAQICFTW